MSEAKYKCAADAPFALPPGTPLSRTGLQATSGVKASLLALAGVWGRTPKDCPQIAGGPEGATLRHSAPFLHSALYLSCQYNAESPSNFDVLRQKIA